MNTSQDACYLPNAPEAVVIFDDGSRLKVLPTERTASRVDLAPGEAGYLIVGTPPVCPSVGHPNVASRMELTLATGDVVPLQGLWVNVECGPPDTVLFSAQGAPTPTPVAMSAVRPTVNAPESAALGSVLTYFVTLLNPSSNAIQFAPCPSYTEFLGAGQEAVPATQTLLLNCTDVKAINPGQSLVFEMKIHIPDTLAAGVAKLSWKLEVPDGVAGGTTIALTR